MVTEGAWWQTMADDAAWQGQWEARRALVRRARSGGQWQTAWRGRAWAGSSRWMWRGPADFQRLLAGRSFVRFKCRNSKSRVVW